MFVTIRLRTLVAFAAGLAVALISVFVFQAWRAAAAPGDSDTTFVSITPCRLIDTRPEPEFHIGTHGRFDADESKSIQARGNNGNCIGIPNDVVGLSLNVTAVGASQPTFLTLWPSGTRPTASSLNPAPGQPPTPNAVTTNLSATGSFNVYNKAGTVDVIIDVNGYYIKTSLQQLRTRIDTLEAAQPFAITGRDDTETVPRGQDVVVVSVKVSAPVSGTVTVVSSTTAKESDPGEILECSITTGTSIDFDYVQEWIAPGIATLSANRAFAIAAKSDATYNLVCSLDGSGTDSTFEDSVLTAIFTPAP